MSDSGGFLVYQGGGEIPRRTSLILKARAFASFLGRKEEEN